MIFIIAYKEIKFRQAVPAIPSGGTGNTNSWYEEYQRLVQTKSKRTELNYPQRIKKGGLCQKQIVESHFDKALSIMLTSQDESHIHPAEIKTPYY